MRKKKLIKRCLVGGHIIDFYKDNNANTKTINKPIMYINDYNTSNGMAGDTLIWYPDNHSFIRHHTNPVSQEDTYSTYTPEEGRLVIQNDNKNLISKFARAIFDDSKKQAWDARDFPKDIYRFALQDYDINYRPIKRPLKQMPPVK